MAAGAGLDLALMRDLRCAASSARFAETYVRVGPVPGAGGAHFLPRRVGTAKAPPLTLSLIKRAVCQGMRNDLRTNLDLIASHYAVVTATPEHREAVQAFIGGRDKG